MSNPLEALQRVNVKIFADAGASVETDKFIRIFHRWIQTAAVEGMLIDVADYSHVTDGPGVMLIAHEGNYALDESGGRTGILYARKQPLEGGLSERLRAACAIALRAAVLLESEDDLDVGFSGQELRIVANDRLHAPNEAATRDAFQPALDDLLKTLYGDAPCEISHEDDSGERFAVDVRVADSVSVATLLERLTG